MKKRITSSYVNLDASFISFAVYKWEVGKWNNCRVNHRQIQQHCHNVTKPTGNANPFPLFAHQKLNPNPLLIGYKHRNVYCTSTPISNKAQQQQQQHQHVGSKSQDKSSRRSGSVDIDKTFHINREDTGTEGKKIMSQQRRLQIHNEQANMSDPFLTSSTFTSYVNNNFCDKLIQPLSNTVCTTHCKLHYKSSRYHISSRDNDETTSNNVGEEINARIMNLCQTFEWSEWSECNLLSNGESNDINYKSNHVVLPPYSQKSSISCDKKLAGVQFRKRKENNINLLDNTYKNLEQKCLSEYEERSCVYSACKRKHRKGGVIENNVLHNSRRKASMNNAIWSRPQLLLTNSLNIEDGGQRKNRDREHIQQKSNTKVLLPLPIQLPPPPPILPEPQSLTSTFIPFLHVGPWGSCKNEENMNNKETQYQNKSLLNRPSPAAKVTSKESQMFGKIMSKKHKRKKKRGKMEARRKRRNNAFREVSRLETRGSWAPELPSDLEITFVATSVSAPQTGVQRRTVECRGQDGEKLPFR